MVRGSTRYLVLKRRLDKLRRHLLFFLPPPPMSKTAYTDQELDLTSAYIVLAHAEIESFLEELVLRKAHRAVQQFDATQRVTPILRKLVAYYVAQKRRSWGEVSLPTPPTVDAAYISFQGHVTNNNGIRRKDIEKLLYPLGVLESSLNQTWLAQMDSFGFNRGGWAHKTNAALNPPDPTTELSTVNQLLQQLLNVDRILNGLR
jgi:hypothetical protein